LTLTAVGNFNEVRDQLVLCKFAKLCKQNKVDFRLLFVGKRIDSLAYLYDDCLKYCVDNELLEQVLFVGVRNDVPAILNQSDIFLYSTNHDTFGIAVVEAMATGIPVFVNDWEVMNEITENGKLATLYKTKDENDLFRQFSLFLQHKGLYIEKAKLASKVVRNKYGIENHISNLKTIYSNLS
jgi:glycosyltransferase involved in cell wall biosynthesis